MLDVAQSDQNLAAASRKFPEELGKFQGGLPYDGKSRYDGQSRYDGKNRYDGKE